MLVQVELKRMSSGDLTLQVSYAVGRLVAVVVYCFSGDGPYSDLSEKQKVAELVRSDCLSVT